MASGLRERFILTRIYKDEQKVKILFLIILGLVFILIANIAYLNLVSFNDLKASYLEEKAPTSTPVPTVVEEVAEPSEAPVVRTENRTNDSGIKEYFIPFGSGTSSSGDWSDVSGLEVVLDYGNYKNIKEVKFEVSVSVPTGNELVWVRLYNKTDNHPVWNSEVTTAGQTTSTYLVSTPLVYDTGSKTYQVQMKTQLKFPANINQSRLHIVLN
jgi:hypothetical protein